MTRLRIATRGSELARAQTEIVTSKLTDLGIESQIVVVETTGDRDRTSSVTALTETGAFVRSVQESVLSGEADLAVHSHKDLPVVGPDGLIGVVVDRGEPWDVLCGSTLDELPEGAKVGTGSPRRGVQLRQLRSDLDVVDIRGNVPTRLRAVERGDLDAVVLAEAGLTRLSLDDHISERFGVDQMVPAPAQASILVEARPEHAELLSKIENVGVSQAVTAERELLAITGAGCRSALGAWGVNTPDGVALTAFVSDADGSRRTTAVGSDAAEKVRIGLGLDRV
ncbi:MAG: hydroxymethylbilane synthase [Acidimicrobiia bacterium]|nr:hydroxymethylbilane synthase [Acidimicrobiia bacterium]